MKKLQKKVRMALLALCAKHLRCFVAATIMVGASTGHAYAAAQSASSTAHWQPPPAPTSSALRVAPQTNLVPLKPPQDIFSRVQPPSAIPPRPVEVRPIAVRPVDHAAIKQPARFTADTDFTSARPLRSGSVDRSPSQRGFLSAIGSTASSGQSQNARANLELAAPNGLHTEHSSQPFGNTVRSNLDSLTSTASGKLADVKDWVGEKTDGMLNGLADSGHEGSWQSRISRMFGGADIKKIFGGLAVVIGGYLGLVWLLRMINPASSGAIPRTVLEVVGNAPLNSKQNLQLIRLGSKLLLVIHGPDGAQPIGEVNDPSEVEELLAMCDGRTKSVAPEVRRAIETQTSFERRSQESNSIGESVMLSPSDSNNLNQLLRNLEKQRTKSHLFEA